MSDLLIFATYVAEVIGVLLLLAVPLSYGWWWE